MDKLCRSQSIVAEMELTWVDLRSHVFDIIEELGGCEHRYIIEDMLRDETNMATGRDIVDVIDELISTNLIFVSSVSGFDALFVRDDYEALYLFRNAFKNSQFKGLVSVIFDTLVKSREAHEHAELVQQIKAVAVNETPSCIDKALRVCLASGILTPSLRVEETGRVVTDYRLNSELNTSELLEWLNEDWRPTQSSDPAFGLGASNVPSSLLEEDQDIMGRLAGACEKGGLRYRSEEMQMANLVKLRDLKQVQANWNPKYSKSLLSSINKEIIIIEAELRNAGFCSLECSVLGKSDAVFD